MKSVTFLLLCGVAFSGAASNSENAKIPSGDLFAHAEILNILNQQMHHIGKVNAKKVAVQQLYSQAMDLRVRHYAAKGRQQSIAETKQAEAE